MRRIRLRTGPAALFGAFFVAALIFFLPLRLALGWSGLGDEGLTARAVGGNVWGGRLAEARVGGLALGDVDAALSPWALLVGRARIALEGRPQGAAPALRGALTVSRHAMGVDGVTASLPTGDVFAPLPVSALDLDQLSVRFRDGACDRAEGRVRATLAGDVAGVALPPTIAGDARCDAGALLLPLASQPGTESVALRITPDGRYRAELVIRPADDAARQKLELAGFVASPAGHRLSVQGSF